MAGLGLLALGVTACATAGGSGRIEPRALLTQIDDGTAPVVVDVRTRREYDAGHVPGAIHVPFYSLLASQDEVAVSHERTVVVYCEHGPRAGIAKLALWLHGYRDVRYLDGHMSAWKARGLPVQTSPANAS